MDKKQIIESNGKERAFPTGLSENLDGIRVSKLEGGLTKREYFAAIAMQGILANPNLVGVDAEGNCFNRADVEKYSLERADALLVALDGSE